MQSSLRTFPGNQLEFIQLIHRPWTTKRIKMLIEKRQTAFTCDGKDSASYKFDNISFNPLFAVKAMYKLNYQAVSFTKLLI